MALNAFFIKNILFFTHLIKMCYKSLNLLEKYTKCSINFQNLKNVKVFSILVTRSAQNHSATECLSKIRRRAN
jgi:hypothetical protein